MSTDYNEDRFNRFLDWLHPNREQALRRYERLRQSQIDFLNNRRCPVADLIVDQAFDSVIKRISEVEDPLKYHAEPYIKRVVYNRYINYLKKAPLPLPDDIQDFQTPRNRQDAEIRERDLGCLANCLEKLPPAHRKLLRNYYLNGKAGKEKAAQESNITIDTLRVQIHRIKNGLRSCVAACRKNR